MPATKRLATFGSHGRTERMNAATHINSFGSECRARTSIRVITSTAHDSPTANAQRQRTRYACWLL